MIRALFFLLCWHVWILASFVPLSPKRNTVRDALKITTYYVVGFGFGFYLAWITFAPAA